MGSIIRGEDSSERTSLPTLDLEYLDHLVRARQLILKCPLGNYTLMKLMNIENFCRIMWGIDRHKWVIDQHAGHPDPQLTSNERTRADTHIYGILGIYREKGLDMLNETIQQLSGIDLQLGELLKGVENFYWPDAAETTILHQVVDSLGYDIGDDALISDWMAKAYCCYGKAQTTGNETCPRMKQKAIAVFSTTLWSFDGWLSMVHGIEQQEKTSKNMSAILTPRTLEKFERPGELQLTLDQRRVEAAYSLVKRAAERIKVTNRALADILHWHVFSRRSDQMNT